jgi:hypothetical protein
MAMNALLQQLPRGSCVVLLLLRSGTRPTPGGNSTLRAGVRLSGPCALCSAACTCVLCGV